MLREIKNIRQNPGEPERQWFADDFFHLWVWRETGGPIVGFQLCYDVAGDQRALSWSKKSGFAHHRVDDGEDLAAGPKASPILVQDGLFDQESIAGRFKEQSAGLEKGLADFVLAKIMESPRAFDFHPMYSIT